MKDPAVLKRFTDFGMEATPTTPDLFRTMARQESQRWGPVIKSVGVHLD